MNKLFSKIKNNSFWRSVLSVGTGNIIAQVFTLVSVPLISRIYTPEAYGEYGVVFSAASIILALAPLGLMSAIMVPETDEESNRVFTTACIAQTGIIAAFLVVTIALQSLFTVYPLSSSYTLSILLLSVYMLFAGLRNLLHVSINRKGYNKTLLFNPIIGSAGNLIITVPLGLLGAGYEGFFIAGIISQGAMCVLMLKKYNAFKTNYSRGDFMRTVKKYKDYVLFQCPANFVETTAQQFPTQFFSWSFGSAAVGGYNMCLKLLQYPSTLIATPISTVYFRTATEYKRNNRDLSTFTYRLVIRSMLIALVPIVIIMLWGDSIFAFILGEQWRQAGTFASILIYQYVLYFCVKSVSYCRVALGYQRKNFAYNLLNLFMVVAACLLGYYITGDLTQTIVYFSVGQCLALIINMAFNFYCMKKHLGKYLVFSALYSAVIIAAAMIKALM